MSVPPHAIGGWLGFSVHGSGGQTPLASVKRLTFSVRGRKVGREIWRSHPSPLGGLGYPGAPARPPTSSTGARVFDLRRRGAEAAGRLVPIHTIALGP